MHAHLYEDVILVVITYDAITSASEIVVPSRIVSLLAATISVTVLHVLMSVPLFDCVLQVHTFS